MVWLFYTPLHCHLEPRCHARFAADARSCTPCTPTIHNACAASEGHHHEHPNSQHQIELTQSGRPTSAPAATLVAKVWTEPESDGPRPPGFGLSGLSPPEITHAWQFLFRAALPARAPSCVS
jgi:hypothetical protein